jgi:hypothetical protein
MFKRIVPTAIAAAVGVIVLTGYLLPRGLPAYPVFAFLRDRLIQWAAIVAALAFILGFFNVLRVHLRRITRGKSNALYSSLLIITALISLALTLIGLTAPLFHTAETATLRQTLVTASNWWFQYVLSPLQASAAALIAFTLTLAGFRLLRGRKTTRERLLAVLFLLAAVIVLIGTLPPLFGPVAGPLGYLKNLVMNVLTTAGVRGLLIGVALGTLLMGLRVITGLDRPYSDS